ncbi:MAG: hypothetical protein EZS28_004128 [Streblomastix strix]|uniref:Uncharacterized protein n=1 Tax=Streblomastix strix TaxID=222440 RepID=A0A5J4WZ05_9EUKA|nr:MAG: hypothetical protein EZS28_004128 [Streblomastix strix]
MVNIPAICMSQDNMIRDIFGDEIKKNNQQANDIILCTMNSDSDGVNDCVLKQLEGDLIQLLSSDKATMKNGESLDKITRGVLKNLSPAALPSHNLNIKIEAPFMLLRNMNINDVLTDLIEDGVYYDLTLAQQKKQKKKKEIKDEWQLEIENALRQKTRKKKKSFRTRVFV